MSEAADKATEIVAEVAEEVAEQATQVAVASRGMSGRDISLVLGGLAVGAGLGGFLGFFFSKKQLETKYHKMAQDEIDGEVEKMREHYRQKTIALQGEQEKTVPLAEKVRELGYSESSPMAITPPEAVVEAAEADKDDPVVVEDEADVEEEDIPEAEVIRNVFEEAEVDDGWDEHRERARRSPVKPYVIHRDEREERETYDEVTLTYYGEDDVLCNEQDEVIGAGVERDKMVGEDNLGRFGHGSGDPSVVYIRNDQLEIQFEVVLSPNSYAEEVHGFTHSIGRYGPGAPRRKVRFDDE